MAAEGLGVVAKLASGFVNTRVSIDNWSFKFYYKYTTSLLLLCSAGTTARQFFGDPIECDAGAVRYLDPSFLKELNKYSIKSKKGTVELDVIVALECRQMLGLIKTSWTRTAGCIQRGMYQKNTRVCAAAVTRRKIENQLSTTPTTSGCLSTCWAWPYFSTYRACSG